MYALTIVGALMVFMISCGEAPKEAPAEVKKEKQEEKAPEAKKVEMLTIVGVAAGNENFSTLVAAVKAADLVGTLNSAGPFTVFAPTNDAFNKLPEGTVASLLKPENKEKLTSILTYHVVAGKLDAASVIKAITDNNGSFTVTTVNGDELSAGIVDGKVVLTDSNGNKSTVVMTDIEASNGVIHAIDSVVMPK